MKKRKLQSYPPSLLFFSVSCQYISKAKTQYDIITIFRNLWKSDKVIDERAVSARQKAKLDVAMNKATLRVERVKYPRKRSSKIDRSYSTGRF